MLVKLTPEGRKERVTNLLGGMEEGKEGRLQGINSHAE